MSLLINALQKAEQGRQQPLEKAEAEDLLLDLAPREQVRGNYAASPAQEETEASSQSSLAGEHAAQQQAARFFAARTASTRSEMRISPLMIGLLLLVVVLLIGGAMFWYVNSLSQPEVIVPRPAAALNTTPLNTVAESNAMQPLVAQEQQDGVEEAPVATALVEASEPGAVPAMTERTAQAAVPVARQAVAAPAVPPVFGEPPKQSANSDVAVTRNRSAMTVNQHVLEGYDAFNRGDDIAAQQAYRQALQADVRNIDALLGMAAIAARQSRQQDAIGWYQQVLQVEPRNGMAQAVLLELQGQADPLSSETKIKNLISQQPQAAYLHAALGNHYAEQEQWALAQQSYFQAHHLDAANPEYVFNLAVSLDQLGKSSLALQYYQQTQDLLASGNSTAVNTAQLAARIRQLQ